MWLEGVHSGLHVEFKCIRWWQKGTCYSIFYSVALNHLGSLLGRGRTVVTAITQVLNLLTVFLIMTHLGTVHKKRKGNSHETINAKLDEGDVVSVENGM
jgi:hypothetical protein